MNERISWVLRVDKVERRTKSVYVSGKGSDATFEERDLGWFVTCGMVTFEVGLTKPDLTIGNALEIRKLEPSL